MNIQNGHCPAGQVPERERGPWYPEAAGSTGLGSFPGEQPGLGAALRARRQAHGWNVPEMARQLREAAKASGDRSVPGNKALCTYIRRWERGPIGPSERYRLHYCKASGTGLRELPGGPQG